ncbi:hypothetical protein D3C73_550210 [compost metagenome]
MLAAIDRGIALETIDDRGEAVENLDAGFLQLHAHRDRQKAADNAGHDREDQVKRADILVIGREQPAGGKTRLVVMLSMRMRVVMGSAMGMVVVMCRFSH